MTRLPMTRFWSVARGLGVLHGPGSAHNTPEARSQSGRSSSISVTNAAIGERSERVSVT
jgi:hypothetical protein